MTLYVWQQDIEYEARKRGLSEGHSEGLREGELLAIIAQVRKKYLKQLSPEETADMLEHDISVIKDIMRTIHEFPDDTDKEIYQRLFADNNDTEDIMK